MVERVNILAVQEFTAKKGENMGKYYLKITAKIEGTQEMREYFGGKEEFEIKGFKPDMVSQSSFLPVDVDSKVTQVVPLKFSLVVSKAK
jgi:hypothetical protein